MTLARPHKFLDAAALEDWLIANWPDVYEDWAFSNAVDWMDLWDWLVYEHDDALSQFEQAWREENANTKTVAT